MNILITAIGKRAQLIQHLKEEFYVVGVSDSFHPGWSKLWLVEE